MRIKFNYKDKEVFLQGQECKSFFSKLRGLMFRSKNFNKNLIFLFEKPTKTPIHSFFCFQKFLGIWLLNNKVVDVKVVKPWVWCVRPKQKFDMLIEIPLRSEILISNFIDGKQKHLKT